MTDALFALLLAPSGKDSGGGMVVLLIQIAAFVGIFYYFIIRPERVKQQRHKELLQTLQRGDQVITNGGIVGEVIHLKDNQITIRSGESRLVVTRSGVAAITNRGQETGAEAGK
jgi:preprotein translocase subunit YajC